MALKLSHKSLKNLIVKAESIGYEGIVEILDTDKIGFNEHMLKGFLEEGVSKGLYVYDKKAKVYAPKPKTSTGGTPTEMFRLSDFMNPAKSKFEQKPYDKAVVESDATWRTTKLAAVKAAKARYYQEVYWPKLQEFVDLELANGAKPKGAADVEDDSQAAA